MKIIFDVKTVRYSQVIVYIFIIIVGASVGGILCIQRWLKQSYQHIEISIALTRVCTELLYKLITEKNVDLFEK